MVVNDAEGDENETDGEAKNNGDGVGNNDGIENAEAAAALWNPISYRVVA